MDEIRIKEIIDELNDHIQLLEDHIQLLEDLKTHVTELQEENRQLISGVNMWFEQLQEKRS